MSAITIRDVVKKAMPSQLQKDKSTNFYLVCFVPFVALSWEELMTSSIDGADNQRED
jgi:hypothetical protein